MVPAALVNCKPACCWLHQLPVRLPSKSHSAAPLASSNVTAAKLQAQNTAACKLLPATLTTYTILCLPCEHAALTPRHAARQNPTHNPNMQVTA
jgi:hypothetical protein